MHLTYNVTEEQALVFTRHFYETSPTFKRFRSRGWKTLPACLILYATIFALLWGTGHPWRYSPVMIGVLAVIGFLILSLGIILLLHRPLYMKNALRMIREGKNKGVFGQRTMTLTDAGIHVKHAVGESTVQRAGIERIDFDGDNTFIYISAAIAHILSRNTVVDGDYDVFVAELKRRWQATESRCAAG